MARSYSDWAEAFTIFAKYEANSDGRGCVGAEHDVIYACADVEEMTQEDRLRLEALGWFVSEEFECWTKFV